MIVECVKLLIDLGECEELDLQRTFTVARYSSSWIGPVRKSHPVLLHRPIKQAIQYLTVPICGLRCQPFYLNLGVDEVCNLGCGDLFEARSFDRVGSEATIPDPDSSNHSPIACRNRSR